jgi:hypothetical protein
MGVIGRVIVGTVLVVSGTTGAAPNAPVRTTVTTSGGWSVVTAPSPGSAQNTLFGIAKMPAGGVWAVGDRVSPQSSRFIAPLIEHWTGTRWVAQVLPGHQTNLLSAYAPARNNLWTAGFFKVGIGALETVPVIDHFNGKTWTIVSAPRPASSVLTAINGTSGTDIWAVGRQVAHAGAISLIEHYDGHAWTRVASPSPATDYLDLGAVAAITPSNVWIAGDYSGSDSVFRTLIEHYDGRTWSIVPSPNLGSGSNYLTALTVFDGRPWVVGRAFDGTNYRPTAMHWTGSAWSGHLLPESGTSDEALNAIVTVGRTLWTVGSKSSAAGTQRTLTMRYRDRKWTVVTSPNLGPHDNVLYAAVASGKTVWAVGNATTRALTMRRAR